MAARLLKVIISMHICAHEGEEIETKIHKGRGGTHARVQRTTLRGGVGSLLPSF